MPDSDELHELERQVERGNLFAHTVLTEHAARTNQTEALVAGLADLLVRLDILDAQELVQAVEHNGRQIREAGRQATLDVKIRIDNDRPMVSADEIDCEARLPYCKAVCCRLRFALTVEEIETGPVKWDLGRPYFNRHGADGYCHQIDGETHGCSVYEDRPTPCRTYSCQHDPRIWTDFEAMKINQEWIDSHLVERSPIEIFMSSFEPESVADVDHDASRPG